MRVSLLAPIVGLALGLAACTDAAPPSPCEPDVGYFEAKVWPVVGRICVACHVAGGAAASSDFVLAPASATGSTMAANLAAARRMALATEAGEPLLLRRPVGTGHPGGMVISPGSAEHRALADFAARVRGDVGACDAPTCRQGDPGPRLLRRLSRAEYDATLRALFGVDARYAPGLVADVVVNGFDNNADALTVTPLLAEQLRQAAEEVAATVAARPDAACAGDGLVCARTWLETRGARVVRRPLTSDELTRWLAVYQVGRDTAAAGVPAHRAGLELMLAALLQSPSFLYRSELGELGDDGRAALTSYEIASELSYFLWSAPPDDELWQAAVADRLRDPAAIAVQARRLLAAPQARAALDRFTDQWLETERLATVARDADLFSTFTPAVRVAMSEEVHRQVADAVGRGASFGDLLTGRRTWIDATLAGFYGVPAPGAVDAAGFGAVDAGDRAGLLAAGAVVAAHARANSTSPVHRGKLVRERLLCQALPPPPPGVVAQPPPLDPTLTARDRYAAHASNPACAGCHRLMDPIGFAFEHFDGVGRWRADEGGLAIDDRGEIIDSRSTNGPFTGVGGLAAALATSPEAAGCFARQWLRWGYGVDEDDPQVACVAAEVEATFAAHGGPIEDLVVALTASVHFRFRQGDGATPTEPGPDGGVVDIDAGAPIDGGATGDPPGLTVSLTHTDDWPTGYCAALIVTNTSAAPITWRVTRPVTGTINNHWSCEISAATGAVTFTGASYNATLAPGARAEAGFCANL